MRKENGLANIGPGEEHDEAVDAQAQSTHGRCTVLERAQEVLVNLHRLGVAPGGEQRLVGQHLALDDGIDELGEAGAALDAGDDEVPGLDQALLLAVRASQGLGDRRVVAQEGRLEQVGLDERERPMRSTPASTSTASSAAATPTRSSPDTLEAATPTNPATSR